MYTNIDALPLGKLLQISYGPRDRNSRKNRIAALRKGGAPLVRI